MIFALIFYTGRLKFKFSIRVIIGMTLGLIVGLTLGQTTTTIDGNETTIIATIRPIGQLYLRLIQMVVIPLVFTAIIKSFTSLESTDKLKSIGARSLFWLLITTTVAAAVGFTFAAIPGLGNDFIPTDTYTRTITPIETVILNFFPNNVFAAFSGNVVLPVIVFAIFISVAIMIENQRHPERTT